MRSRGLFAAILGGLCLVTVVGCVDLTPPAGLAECGDTGCANHDAASATDGAPQDGGPPVNDGPQAPDGSEADGPEADEVGDASGTEDVPTDGSENAGDDVPGETGADAAEDAPDDAAEDTPGDTADDGPRPLGAPCMSAGECTSGFCVDGVCCEGACGNPCFACNVAGTVGTCSPVPAGDDPDDDCPADAPESCNRDGTCDGKGGCRLREAGEVCAPASCSGATAAQARTCDGMGACRPPATTECAPYVCAGTVCATSCSSRGDCTAPAWCNGGKCVAPLAAGATCTAAEQCASGFCVDGVCCESACGGTCQACNVSGSLGSCVPVPAGEDPGDECAASPASTCALDGSCDGKGACRLHPAGTVCAPKSCTVSTEYSERTCDGMGLCRPAAQKACDPYRCAGDTCGTSCASAGDCVGSSFCDGGNKCAGLLANGASCTGGNECNSGHCVDGVCCQSACTDPCHSCALTASPGTCQPAPAGTDPRDDCGTQTASTCGNDGTCNGTGGCRLHAAGTPCADATCSADVETSARTCDGAGTCRSGTTRMCQPYVCGPTACKTSCAGPADCQNGQYCDGAACQPKLNTGSPCTSDGQCASNSCVDDVCCQTSCTQACYACNVTGSVGTCTPEPPKALVGHWKLDETSGTTAADASCNGNNGTLKEYASPTWQSGGRIGGALGFNGTSNWVRVPDSTSLDSPAATGKLTVAAWTRRAASQTGHATILSRQVGTTGAEHFGLYYLDDKPTGIVRSGGTVSNCSGPTAAATGTWLHLAMTWDGGTARVYLNGTQVCSFARTGTIPTDSTPLIIGGNANSSADDAQELFNGMIDDVVMYNRALSAAEIQSLASGNAPPTQ